MMKNNREKIGTPMIDWKEVAFGAGKNRRKTIGFGKYDKKERQYEDEIYIRELSIVDGGIGCAVWDAAIILTRWIYGAPQLFQNQVLLELGAGVGLPGICAARFAKNCFLTDYLTPVVDNLQYNIDINGSIVSDDNGDDDDDSGDSDGSDNSNEDRENKYQSKLNVKKSAKAVLLNWDNIDNFDLMIQDDSGVLDIPKRGVDIILGSELTYTGNENTINHLIRVIDHFLRPFGVFVEVLSDDRDGVAQFLVDVKANGYNYEIIPVHERYLGNYNTKQKAETYKFYVFVRENEMENNELFTATCQSMK